MLNGLDLFSGIGGLTVALSPWVRPYLYCESDRYAQSVLLSRMADRSLPRAPIWDDVRTLSGDKVNLPIDIIYGGFPCQDISVAGAGSGLEGGRSGLFFDIVRLTRELRPGFVFLENVPALAVRGLDRVLLELNALGFDCRWTIVSAAEMGAPHLRERIWILAHAGGERVRHESEPEPQCARAPEPIPDGQKRSLADADCQRREKRREKRRGCLSIQAQESTTKCSGEIPNSAGIGRGQGPDRRAFSDGPPALVHANGAGCAVPQEGDARRWLNGEGERIDSAAPGTGWWDTEPDVGRVAHGVSLRVDRLRGLGNSVVPAAAREAFCRLAGVTMNQDSRRRSEVNHGR